MSCYTEELTVCNCSLLFTFWGSGYSRWVSRYFKKFSLLFYGLAPPWSVWQTGTFMGSSGLLQSIPLNYMAWI